jgi:hypothetical protein
MKKGEEKMKEVLIVILLLIIAYTSVQLIRERHKVHMYEDKLFPPLATRFR